MPIRHGSAVEVTEAIFNILLWIPLVRREVKSEPSLLGGGGGGGGGVAASSPARTVSNAVWQIVQCITHALFGLCLPVVLYASSERACVCVCCPWATVQ